MAQLSNHSSVAQLVMTLKTKPEMLDWFPDLQLNFLFHVLRAGNKCSTSSFLKLRAYFCHRLTKKSGSVWKRRKAVQILDGKPVFLQLY